jgi:3-oxoacyl-[acyl-carrier protein] reductase
LSADGGSFERYCLVSGGSGGIGAAVCLQLAERGVKPVVGYHQSGDVARGIAKRCGGLALHLDLNDEESIGNASARLEQLPLLSGVVLAGSPPLSLTPFGKITSEQMERQWRVNVLGPQRLLAQLVRGCFRKHKAGAVVGVLTRAMGNAEGRASPSMGAYVIAKHGLAGVLALLAADYAWLRVRTVSPGYTETNMLRAFDERFLELERAKAPFQAPESVAGLILKEAFDC